MYTNFNYELQCILNNSKTEMMMLNHSYIGTEHFILSLLKTNNGISSLLKKQNITYDLFKKKVIEKVGIGQKKNKLFIFTPLLKKILEEAVLLSSEYKNKIIDTSLVFKLMIEEAEGVAYRIFCEMNVNLDDLLEDTYEISHENSEIFNYGIDLNEKVKNDYNNPVIGREKELNNIIEILLRKNKRNPLLIGDAGVGKTAIIELLAFKINNQEVPSKLINKKIISISMANLVSGTKYRGEFEEKMLKIIKDLEASDRYILFIDEIHTLVGAGGAEGAIDAGNILKPALARGNIIVIGATTKEEYRKYIEDDKALSRRFQKVIINEPTEKEVYTILTKVKKSYENYHKVKISSQTIKHIIKISNKYILNRKEPDRSLDIMDEVCSLVSSKFSKEQINNNKLKNKLKRYKELKDEMVNNNNYTLALTYRKKERIIESQINKNIILTSKNEDKMVKIEDVNELLSNKYNVVINDRNVIKSEMANLKKEFKSKNVNKKIVNSFINSCIDLFDSGKKIKKPISFLFIGEKEKIELLINFFSKKIINNNIISIDLSEYKDEQAITKIIGASPGYIGFNNKNSVFESLKETPLSLVVFNNYEHAHNSVKDLIKQIINKGYFTDSNGYKISFLNTIIVVIDNSKINSIGFNNSYIKNFNNISNIVNKTIIFSKEKNKITN